MDKVGAHPELWKGKFFVSHHVFSGSGEEGARGRHLPGRWSANVVDRTCLFLMTDWRLTL